MDTESKTYVFGNEGNNGGMVPAWTLLGNNNGFGGGMNGGWGTGILGFLLGALIGNNGLFGSNGFGGNGFGAAGYLGNQMNNDNNTDLIMQAVTSQGEQSRQAVQTLSTMLGQDFNLVNSGVEAIQSALTTMAVQNATTPLQIINQLQNGNSQLASQLCQCCCDMRQQVLTQGYESRIQNMQQTETLGNAINGNGRAITDAISDLKATMIQSFCDVKEREMQSKIDTQADIITQLRNAENNAAQTAQIAAMIAPMQAKLVEIESKQVNTVPVPWPNLQAVNTTPNVGGFYGNGWFGNGWNNGLAF